MKDKKGRSFLKKKKRYLSTKQVEKIRELIKEGYTQLSIALEMDISQSTISRIANGSYP